MDIPRFLKFTDTHTYMVWAWAMETDGPSNLTKGRIAVAHGRFCCTRQDVPMCTHNYTVSSKNVTALSHYNSDIQESISCTDVAEKVGNRKVHYFPT